MSEGAARKQICSFDIVETAVRFRDSMWLHTARWCRLDVLTPCSYDVAMSTSPKRATIYFDPMLHRALRLKAAETDRSMSDLVNEAVKFSLAEDADDLAAFDERAAEPNLPFEDVVRELKGRGKL